MQIMLNGHEWVERQANKQTISVQKEGNCFVGGSFQGLDQIADTLCDHHTIGRLTQLCDRWAYSSCLCFALDLEEQSRSKFRYRYSVFLSLLACKIEFYYNFFQVLIFISENSM